MIQINGTDYRLMLLDTNVLSEIVKNNQGERKRLVQLMTSENIFPCVSIHSIFEIRKRPDLFEEFLGLFSLVPFILINPDNKIFEEELKNYPNPDVNNVVGFAFSFVKPDPNANTRTFIAKIFSNPEVQKVEEAWNNVLKRETMDSLLSLKKNFVPTRIGTNGTDAKRFADQSLPQYLASTAPEWVTTNADRFKTLRTEAFPSVLANLYNVYYRFYDENRQPEENDVFDILITSAAAYMDLLVTERFQAEIFRKVKNKGNILMQLDIKTIEFVRSQF